MKDLGNRIKLARNKRTQEEFASMLDVDRTTLASWEIDRREPDLDTLVKIADIAEVSLDWLAGRKKNLLLNQAQYHNDPKWYEVKELVFNNNVNPNKIMQLIKAALALK